MKRSILGVTFAGLMLAACADGGSAPPLAPSLDGHKDEVPDKARSKTPYSSAVWNPCPPVPELVIVEGTSHYRVHFKHFEEGNTSKSQDNTQAKGIGAVTGVQYTFHQLSRHRTSYLFEDKTFHSDQQIRWHVISATNLGNFFATVHQKVTCPFGAPCTLEVIKVETDCRG